METKSSSTPLPKEIFVNEIEFYSKNEIYLFGFMHSSGKFHETRYSIERKQLQKLLSANQSIGVEILWQIEQLWLYPHSVPATINLVDLFGTTQVFTLQTHTEHANPAFLQYRLM